MLLTLLIRPIAERWIKKTLAQYADQRICVWDLKFRRLERYFSEEFLRGSYVVFVDEVPIPSLMDVLARLWRLPPFQTQGLSLIDTCFIRRECWEEESLHFHELVHVLQWRTLGVKRFLNAYIEGILRDPRSGIYESLLEEMAYRHQQRFVRGEPPYDIAAAVREELASAGL